MTDDRELARQRLVMDYPVELIESDEGFDGVTPTNLEQRYWDEGPDPDPTFSSTAADMEARQAMDYPVDVISPGRGGPIPTNEVDQDVPSDHPTPGAAD